MAVWEARAEELLVVGDEEPVLPVDDVRRIAPFISGFDRCFEGRRAPFIDPFPFRTKRRIRFLVPGATISVFTNQNSGTN